MPWDFSLDLTSCPSRQEGGPLRRNDQPCLPCPWDSGRPCSWPPHFFPTNRLTQISRIGDRPRRLPGLTPARAADQEIRTSSLLRTDPGPRIRNRQLLEKVSLAADEDSPADLRMEALGQVEVVRVAEVSVLALAAPQGEALVEPRAEVSVQAWAVQQEEDLAEVLVVQEVEVSAEVWAAREEEDSPDPSVEVLPLESGELCRPPQGPRWM